MVEREWGVEPDPALLECSPVSYAALAQGAPISQSAEGWGVPGMRDFPSSQKHSRKMHSALRLPPSLPEA